MKKTVFDEKDDYQFMIHKTIEGITEDGVTELLIERDQYVNELADISKITYDNMKDTRHVFGDIESEFDTFFDKVQAYEFFNS